MTTRTGFETIVVEALAVPSTKGRKRFGPWAAAMSGAGVSAYPFPRGHTTGTPRSTKGDSIVTVLAQWGKIRQAPWRTPGGR